MIAWSIIPLANLLAGPLADRVFEPLLSETGVLSGTVVGELIGVGTGRGIALIFIFSAFFLWLTSLYAFANPRIRNLEQEIPDAIQETLPKPASQADLVPEEELATA